MQNLIINNWETFKEICITKKKLLLQYVENERVYDIFAPDSDIIMWNTTLLKGSAEATDFENNYKANANQPLPYTMTAGQSKFIGRTIEMASEDTQKSCEWIFDIDVYVSKVLPISVDAQWGDYVEFEVWLADDSMMLNKYGETIPVYNGLPNQWFEGTGAGKIPIGCKVKCTYYKASGATRKFIAIVEFII